MASLKNVTRESMIKAMDEYDRIGADAFHAKHGTAASTKYEIRHNGKAYPSKAIIAVAGGVSPKDFSGGPGRLEKIVDRCGFKLGQLAFGFAAALTAIASSSAPAKELPTVSDLDGAAVYFASGSSRPADIRGFGAIGHAIGVAANELSANAENELYRLAGSGVPVFVDSGAFSEVEFNARHKCTKRCARGTCIGNGNLPRPELPEGAPFTADPISPAEWTKRLNLYARLTAVYAEAGAAHDLYLVAPDKVAHQDETLERIETYKHEIRCLIELGANVLVVAQRGRLSQAECDAKAEEILGTSSYVRALPCNKGATSPEMIAAFCAARKPARLHLLGMGPKSSGVEVAIEAVSKTSPETILFLDSNLIASAVGRSNGKGGGPRVLTAARDLATSLIGAGKAAIRDAQELGIILAFGLGYQLSLLT